MTSRVAGIGLVILVLATTVLRDHLSTSLPWFDARDSTGYFWTEGAVHYRHARMVADGVGIPDTDRALQYPEGIAPRRHLTLLMDFVSGDTYRLLKPVLGSMTFHVYLIHLTSFVSSLSVVAVFFLAWVLFRSWGAALLAGVIFATAPSSLDRLVGTYERESFAVPLLLGSLAAFAASCDESRGRRAALWGLIAAALTATGLAAWHFARFYYLMFTLSCCAWFVVNGGRPRLAESAFGRPGGAEAPDGFRWGILLVSGGALLVGSLVPVLQESRLVLSPAFILSLALLLGLEVDRRFFPGRSDGAGGVRRRALLLASFSVPLVAVALALAREASDFGHVYSLLWAKIVHLGVKPEDPARLTDEARFLWVDGFNSPTAPYLLTRILPIALMTATGLVGLHRGRFPVTRSPAPFLVAMLSVCFVVLYFFVRRLSIFAVAFLAVWAAAWLWRTTVRFRVGAALLAVPLVLLQTNETLHVNGRTWFRRAAAGAGVSTEDQDARHWGTRLGVLYWIRDNTDSSDVFLGPVGFSPAILAYSGRPIAVHPMYETAAIRGKVREFYGATYASPESLLACCRRWGVSYYLHTMEGALNTSPDGTRYMADALTLRKSSAAFLCQFAPERLPDLELVYQDPSCRLFHIREDGRTVPAMRRFQDPVYDIKTFGSQELEGDAFDDRSTAEVLDRLERARLSAEAGRKLLAARQIDEAIKALEAAIELNYWVSGAHGYLGVALAEQGRYPEALAAGNTEVNLDRDSAEAHYNMGYIHNRSGRYTSALREFEIARDLKPTLKDVNSKIQDLKRRLGTDGQGR